MQMRYSITIWWVRDSRYT